MLENDSLVGIFDVLEHLILFRKLPESICFHVEGAVGSFVLQGVVEGRLRKRHGVEQDLVCDHDILLSLRALHILQDLVILLLLS